MRFLIVRDVNGQVLAFVYCGGRLLWRIEAVRFDLGGTNA
jgi:hypothetical protein